MVVIKKTIHDSDKKIGCGEKFHVNNCAKPTETESRRIFEDRRFRFFAEYGMILETFPLSVRTGLERNRAVGGNLPGVKE